MVFPIRPWFYWHRVLLGRNAYKINITMATRYYVNMSVESKALCTHLFICVNLPCAYSYFFAWISCQSNIMKIRSRFLQNFHLDRTYSLLTGKCVRVLLEYFRLLDLHGTMTLNGKWTELQSHSVNNRHLETHSCNYAPPPPIHVSSRFTT